MFGSKAAALYVDMPYVRAYEEYIYNERVGGLVEGMRARSTPFSNTVSFDVAVLCFPYDEVCFLEPYSAEEMGMETRLGTL